MSGPALKAGIPEGKSRARVHGIQQAPHKAPTRTVCRWRGRESTIFLSRVGPLLEDSPPRL